MWDNFHWSIMIFSQKELSYFQLYKSFIWNDGQNIFSLPDSLIITLDFYSWKRKKPNQIQLFLPVSLRLNYPFLTSAISPLSRNPFKCWKGPQTNIFSFHKIPVQKPKEFRKCLPTRNGHLEKEHQNQNKATRKKFRSWKKWSMSFSQKMINCEGKFNAARIVAGQCQTKTTSSLSLDLIMRRKWGK